MATNILLIWNKLKLCVTALYWMRVSQAPSTHVTKERMPLSCRKQNISIEVRQTSWRHLHGNKMQIGSVYQSEFLLQTAPSNEKWSTQLWYSRARTGPYVCQCCRLVDESLIFVLGRIPSFSSDVMHRALAYFKCEDVDVNNEIPIDFNSVNLCLWNSVDDDQPYCESISWYIQPG